MDVRDRSTYVPNLENTGVEMPSRLRTEGQTAPSTNSLATGRDSSDLSPAAHVVAQAMQMPEIRQDRIANLQKQIANGSYQVAPQEVANAMLRNLAG
jgi:negative regulator of flagellin synthesis FlgM